MHAYRLAGIYFGLKLYLLFYFYYGYHWRSSHYAITLMLNKNSNIQGRSPKVVKVIFHTIRNCSKRKEFAPSGSKFFSLREAPIMKNDAIEENHCLI